jgi:hypothetical protein
MNDLHKRINTIIEAFASNSLKEKKVATALNGFMGMEITHLTKQKMNSIHKHMGMINSIISSYPIIKTKDDYKFMTEIDLDKILKNIQQLCLKLLID